MSAGLLRVENLGKAYRCYGSEWQRVFSWFGLPVKPQEEHWVLRHVSFAVQPGEAIGIVGQNGAGKSTLLKLITGTQRPTAGSVHITGRVSAILELGMGFNAEFTGRQNAQFSAGLMGFNHADIDRVISEIEAFADIGEYFDQPVRTYSSGMQMRVAFATATAFRPEILIVDEALAVGDAAFQRKCFQRIESFLIDGTSLLYVSHDIEGIKKLCSRAVFLKHGRLESIGAAKEVCDSYEKHLFGGGGAHDQQKVHHSPAPKAHGFFDPGLVAECELSYGDGRAAIERVWLENADGLVVNVLSSLEPFSVNYCVRFSGPAVSPIFATMIKTREGIAIYGTDTTRVESYPIEIHPGMVLQVRFVLKSVLAPGTYYLNCGVREDRHDGPVFLHRKVDTLIFRVTAAGRETVGAGLVDMKAVAQIWPVAEEVQIASKACA
ncbi:MAG: ABC transporter ATP-binding protein [Gammaproteobacteria bacterium]|nr:ABC transporter ATP-binding protein [Gammaproteobacteria bacterium]